MRTADRQPHAETARLGAEERLEDAIRRGFIQAGPAVFHGHQDLACLIRTGLNHQDAGSVVVACIASMPFMTRLMMTCWI